MGGVDAHTILGVPFDATDEQLARAYRALAKRHHPDRPGAGDEALDRMRQINAAYDELRASRRGAPIARPRREGGHAAPRRRVPGAWLDPALRRALGPELLAALEPSEPVLLLTPGTTWDSHELHLAVTDRRLLWLRDDAIVQRVRSLPYPAIARVEGRLRRPLRRTGELRVHQHLGRPLSFADLPPRTLETIVRTVSARLEPRTPPPAPAARPFVAALDTDHAMLWAVGDSADGSARARRVADRIPDAAALDLFLYLGDVYSEGTAEEYARHYDPLYGRLAPVTAPTPGNHEWSNRLSGYAPYWTRARGVPTPALYAFAAAGWLVLSLNSEAPCAVGTPQHDWLEAQLAVSRAPVLAFWHRPRFSAGEHGDQADVAPLWEALRGRAVLVLSAHDHNLQRLHPVDGITQFVVGAGGRSTYALDRSWRRWLPRRHHRLPRRRTWRDPRLAFGDDVNDGVLRLELRPGEATFAFVAADGRTLDAGTLRPAAG